MNNIKMIFFLTVSALAGAVIALMLFFCFVGPRPQGAPPADVGKGSTLPGSALVPEPVVVPPGSASGLQREFAAAINNSMPAVVLITAQKRIGVVSPYSNLFDYRRRKIDYLDVPSGQGSGFFIRAMVVSQTSFKLKEQMLLAMGSALRCLADSSTLGKVVRSKLGSFMVAS